MDMPPDLPERVAVLERLLEKTELRMNRIEDQLAAIRTDIAQLRADLGGKIEFLNGSLTHVPRIWHMVILVFGSQFTLAGLLFAAYRLGH